MSNINIVTHGGKKTSTDYGTNKQHRIINLVLTKRSYDSNQQKQYYKDATKIFNQLVSTDGTQGEKQEFLRLETQNCHITIPKL